MLHHKQNSIQKGAVFVYAVKIGGMGFLSKKPQL